MSHTLDTYDLLSVLDDEIPYLEWMEEDLYHDASEAAYNEMLMDGHDL